MHRSDGADVVALAGTGVKKLYPGGNPSTWVLFHFLPVFIKVRLYDKEIKYNTYVLDDYKHFPNDMAYSKNKRYRIKIAWHKDQTFDFYVNDKKLTSYPLRNSYGGMTKINYIDILLILSMNFFIKFLRIWTRFAYSREV